MGAGKLLLSRPATTTDRQYISHSSSSHATQWVHETLRREQRLQPPCLMAWVARLATSAESEFRPLRPSVLDRGVRIREQLSVGAH